MYRGFLGVVSRRNHTLKPSAISWL